MTDAIEDLIDYIKDSWDNWRDKDKKISIKFITTILNVVINLIDCITDIWETWKDKDEKILSKVIWTIIAIIFFIIGIKIWI